MPTKSIGKSQTREQRSNNAENQNGVEKHAAIDKLVALLSRPSPDNVRAEAAAALAVLAEDNLVNQDKVAASDGIQPLMSMRRVESRR